MERKPKHLLWRLKNLDCDRGEVPLLQSINCLLTSVMEHPVGFIPWKCFWEMERQNWFKSGMIRKFGFVHLLRCRVLPERNRWITLLSLLVLVPQVCLPRWFWQKTDIALLCWNEGILWRSVIKRLMPSFRVVLWIRKAIFSLAKVVPEPIPTAN